MQPKVAEVGSREGGFRSIGFCGIVAHLWRRIVHGMTGGLLNSAGLRWVLLRPLSRQQHQAQFGINPALLLNRIHISCCVTGTRRFVGYLAG